MRKSLHIGLLAAAGLVATGMISSAMASPSLTGNVTANYVFPSDGTVDATSTFAVGTPLDCPAGGGVCVDFAEPGTFSASGLALTVTEQAGSSYTAIPFNGIQWAGLTLSDGSSITGFTLDTNLSGLTASDVSFTGNSIEFNAEGDTFIDSSYFVTLNLETGASSAVPEPLTLSLFGAGLAGALAMRRRKKA